jgi:hypothetical protein
LKNIYILIAFFSRHDVTGGTPKVLDYSGSGTCNDNGNSDPLQSTSEFGCRQITIISSENYYYSSPANAAPFYVQTTCTGLSPTATPTLAPTAVPTNPTNAPTVIPTPAGTAITGSLYLYTLNYNDNACTVLASANAVILNQCVFSDFDISTNYYGLATYQKITAYQDSSSAQSYMIVYYSDPACTTVLPNYKTDGSYTFTPITADKCNSRQKVGIAASGSTGLPTTGLIERYVPCPVC